MRRLGIFVRDIDEKFIRSSGPGGQNVNKVSTCVALKHRPSGIEIKCAKTRSQAMNRYYARVLLAEKIEKITLGRKSESEKKQWKATKQKRRRSKRAKEKVLDHKRKQSEKKKMRRSVSDE
jgi:peptide chain release factor